MVTLSGNIGGNICLHENRKTARNALFLRLSELFFVTGDERIELPPKVLETPIIPFDQSPESSDRRGMHKLVESLLSKEIMDFVNDICEANDSECFAETRADRLANEL